MKFPENYRIKPGANVRLSKWDASDTSPFGGSKEKGEAAFDELNKKLEALQELLYAEHKRKVLVVLQGMDTSGKDGTVRHVLDGVNPQGVRVYSFKKPSENELERDYLWRVHLSVPRQGHIAIFNRSHYEDVLVPRVEKLISGKDCERRYRQINDFERMLAEEGTILRKFFLHIDADEQRERLKARQEESEKNWKLSEPDFEGRKRWTDFQAAYESAISATSTEHAPWYVVPANKKWYRNLVVSTVLVETLEGLKMKFPAPEKGLADRKIPAAK